MIVAALSQVTIAMEDNVQAKVVESPLRDYLKTLNIPVSEHESIVNHVEGFIVRRAIDTVQLASFAKTPEAQSEKGKKIIELKQESLVLFSQLEVALIFADRDKANTIMGQICYRGQRVINLQK